jgi:hypothetical protein
MRKERELAENVWYYVRTAVNDREPVFWSKHLIWLFERVLSELSGIYAVEIRGLRFETGPWCRFISSQPTSLCCRSL